MAEHEYDDLTTWVSGAYAETPAPRPEAVEAAALAAQDQVVRERAARAATVKHAHGRPVPDRTRGSALRFTSWRWITGTAFAAAACAVVAWWGTLDHGAKPQVAPSRVSTGPSVNASTPLGVRPKISLPGTVAQNRTESTAHTPNPSTSHGTSRADLAATSPVASPIESPAESLATPAPMSSRVAQTAPSNVPPQSDPRIPNASAVAGLDAPSAALVTRVLDSAASRGLPMTSLIARVREGVRRRVPGPRIAVVARNYAAALLDARTAIGENAPQSDIQSGAEALVAGAPPMALQQLRTARPTGKIGESLLALADLTSHGVAPLRASAALATLMTNGGSDGSIRVLRADVIGDIVRGASPNAALAGHVPHPERAPQAPVAPASPRSSGTLDSTQTHRGTP